MNLQQYELLDAEASAAMNCDKLFGGAVVYKDTWEVEPLRRIFALERGGLPDVDVSKVAAAVARSMIGQLAGLGVDMPAPYIGAVPAGGLTIEANVADRELTFAISNDGTVEYLKAGADEPFEEGSFSLHSPGRLRELVSWLLGRRSQMDAAA